MSELKEVIKLLNKQSDSIETLSNKVNNINTDDLYLQLKELKNKIENIETSLNSNINNKPKDNIEVSTKESKSNNIPSITKEVPVTSNRTINDTVTPIPYKEKLSVEIKNLLIPMSKNIDHFKDSLDKFKMEILTLLEKEVNNQTNENTELIKKSSNDIKEQLDLFVTQKKEYLDNALLESENKIEIYLENNSITNIAAFEKELNTLRKKVYNTNVTLGKNFKNDLHTSTLHFKKLINENIGNTQNENNTVDENVETLNIENNDIVTKIKDLNLKSTLEFKIGSNVTSILGILFILAGIIYGATIPTFNVYLRSASMYIAGILFLLFGEYVNKKSKSYFSVSLTAAGISILHLATALSYFYLDNVLNTTTFILASIIVTALAYFLALKYDSETISLFASIGGYMPLLRLGIDATYIITMMIYVTIFNLLTYFITLKKYWNVTKYVTFVLSLIINVTLINLGLSNEILNYFTYILYATVTFAIFILVAVVYPIKHNKKVKDAELLLTIINTFTHTIIVLAIIQNYQDNLLGLMTLLLVVFYFFFEKYISANFKNNSEIKISMFYKIYTLTLSVLLIPFQFNSFNWILTAWFLQSLVFYIFGIYSKRKMYKYFGIIIYYVNMFCIFTSFLYFIGMDSSPFHNPNMEIPYLTHFTLLTLWGIIAVFTELLFKKKNNEKIIEPLLFNILKSSTLLVVYFYVYYLLRYHIVTYSPARNFYIILYLIEIVALINFAIYRSKVLLDEVVHRILIVSSLAVIVGSTLLYYDFALDVSTLLKYYIFIQTIAVKCLSLCLLYYLIKLYLNDKIKKESFTVISLMTYLNVIYVTLVQYDFDIASLSLSVIILIVSIISITLGFILNNDVMRRLNLGVTFLSIAKIFLIDISYNTTEDKFINYITFGLVLLAISYVYNRFEKLSTKKLKEEFKED